VASTRFLFSAERTIGGQTREPPFDENKEARDHPWLPFALSNIIIVTSPHHINTIHIINRVTSSTTRVHSPPWHTYHPPTHSAQLPASSSLASVSSSSQSRLTSRTE
jgi:hypothetical protein